MLVHYRDVQTSEWHCQSSQSHFSQNEFLTSKSLINNIYYNIYYLLPNFKESQNEFDYFDFDYHDYDAKKISKIIAESFVNRNANVVPLHHKNNALTCGSFFGHTWQ